MEKNLDFMNMFKNADVFARDSQVMACILAQSHVCAFYNEPDFKESKRFQRFVKCVESQLGDFVGRLRRMPWEEDETPKEILEQEIRVLLFSEIKSVVERRDEDDTWLYQAMGLKQKPNLPLDGILDVGIVRGVYGEVFEFYDVLYRPVDGASTRSWRNYIRNCISVILDIDECSDIYQVTLPEICYDYVMERAIKDELENGNWFSRTKVIDDRDCLILFIQLYKTYAERVSKHIVLKMWGTDSTKRLRAENLQMEEKASFLQDKIAQLTNDLGCRDAQLSTLRKENSALKANIQNIDNSYERIATLERDLKKKKTECEDLADKCSRLEEQINELWASQIEQPNAETGPSNTLNLDEITQDPLSKTARVVFVRDVERKNYVMMKRLEEIFPRAKFTNGVASDINVNATDLIVALTAYTSHSVYYKGADLAKRQNVPFMPIKNANVEIIASEVLRKLKQISPEVSCE